MNRPAKPTPLLAVAPMLDWTDRHCRYFHRQLSPSSILYTEMVTTGALLHGDTARFLAFHPQEKPLILQLGGSEPNALAHCARLAENAGFSGINLNVGCPSDRVRSGQFGACLMATPLRVADGISAMKAVTGLPLSVKTRIGIDTQDSYAFLYDFVNIVQSAGCDTFIIHARKAWLTGLSPKENRDIPPLDYPRVYRLKQDFPGLSIILNGGIKTIAEIEAHYQQVDGVMIGREAYQNPYRLHEIDTHFASKTQLSRVAMLTRLFDYMENELCQGTRLHAMTRHLLGLFNGLPGARQFRRTLSELGTQKNAGLDVIKIALQQITHD